MKLKDDLCRIFLQKEQQTDWYGQVYTVAHAWVLFERLIIKGAIRKHSVRFYLAACLRISVKLIEYFGDVTNEEIAERTKKLDDDINQLLVNLK